MLACADIEEGVVLRRAGVRVPILVFGALSVSDLDGLFEFRLTPTISSPAAARAVQAAAAKHATTLGYHLKIDTGMNRLGFRHDNLRRTLPDLLASPNLGSTRSTRTSRRPTSRRRRCSTSSACTSTRALIDDRCDRSFGARGRDVPPRGNSAALLRDSRVWYDCVRPGLLLYGIVPPPLRPRFR